MISPDEPMACINCDWQGTFAEIGDDGLDWVCPACGEDVPNAPIKPWSIQEVDDGRPT